MQLNAAYNDVRDDNSDTDWALVGYTSNGKALEVRGTGSGGLDELKEGFVEDEPMFAYLRITTGDEDSIRQKFCLISWCGTKVKALKKARMSVHKASFKEVFREYAVEMHYTEQSEVNYDELRARVIASGGANYSGAT